ncbi:hypothetical protein EJ02DRAFT_460508 [Clathrospora elynae]|uniref:Uncharacterized protein n=1 Tax=Clathrospora elynae TaxID=706981 RepID=A0A6A5SA61_9PLEO|nr:hypothetical protein EJ02DRAFT_460508 [Clathrospora elynae]
MKDVREQETPARLSRKVNLSPLRARACNHRPGNHVFPSHSPSTAGSFLAMLSFMSHASPHISPDLVHTDTLRVCLVFHRLLVSPVRETRRPDNLCSETCPLEMQLPNNLSTIGAPTADGMSHTRQPSPPLRDRLKAVRRLVQVGLHRRLFLNV